jgi:hypothetical protein
MRISLAARGLGKSGRNLASGSSKESFPASTSWATATAVIILLTDARLNAVSIPFARRGSLTASPYADAKTGLPSFARSTTPENASAAAMRRTYASRSRARSSSVPGTAGARSGGAAAGRMRKPLMRWGGLVSTSNPNWNHCSVSSLCASTSTRPGAGSVIRSTRRPCVCARIIEKTPRCRSMGANALNESE